MSDAEFRFIGKPIRRVEDARLVTGQGRFSDDFHLDGQTYAAMVRSPYPHARIVNVDAARAKKMPGVLGVFTGADCIADKLNPIPHDPLPKTKYDMKLSAAGGKPVFIGPHMLLPADKARHVGEAVAMVVAATKAQALDAAEAVEVAYEELPFVIHSGDAMKPGAPKVWDEVPDNITVDTWFGDRAATDQAFAAADHVVKMEAHIGRVTGVPLEPRAAVGQYDAATGRYTLHAGSGGAVRQKNELAGVLGVAPDMLHVLSYDVGGNFGTRNRVFVESGRCGRRASWAVRSIHRDALRSFLSDYQAATW
jgi:carbon-monoxide dehydrogenase large subunit